MMRTQQLECYAAEGALENGRTFRDVAETQRFVDDLRDTPWWNLQGYSLHVLRIEVGPASKLSDKFDGVGWYDPEMNAGRIELKARALNERVVLHEVAHVLAQAISKSKSHDPVWARTYLTLVSCVMGADAYLTLKAGFDELAVDYDVPPAAQASGIAL